MVISNYHSVVYSVKVIIHLFLARESEATGSMRNMLKVTLTEPETGGLVPLWYVL